MGYLDRTRKTLRLLEEGPEVLRKLIFHHQSQAKPHTPPVSNSYHASLAVEVSEILSLLEELRDGA